MMGYKERSLSKRNAYLRLRERYLGGGKTLVYIDESGFEPSVARRYGYAAKGKRVYGGVSGRSRPRTSLIAARLGENLEEPFRFERPCNAEVFNGWLQRQLCPWLKDIHVVVMDKVAFHKGATTAALIHGKGAALLFLPPYSPDFNPIEHDFAAIKTIRDYNALETLDDIIKSYR